MNDINSLLIGGGISIVSVIISTFLNYFATKWRAEEERNKNYEMELNRLRLDAAQKAYQYIFKIHRASARKALSQQIADEARDWLDGQAIILGDRIHTSVFSYFNYVLTNSKPSEIAKAMNRAETLLKEVMIKPIKLNQK